MTICVYDNPATMQRECWQDGRLQASYSHELFSLPKWPVPANQTHMGVNHLGDWKTGQMTGDPAAMKPPEQPK